MADSSLRKPLAAPPADTDTLISVSSLKQLVYRLSGYKIQIADDDPLLTTIYINRAVLGEALNKAEVLQSNLQKQIASLPAAADLEMKRAASEAVTSLSAEVGKIANRVAGNAAAAERNKALAWAVAASVIGAGLCIILGFGAGLGWNKLETARIEKAAQQRVDQAEKDVAWMQTSQGKAAKQLADLNVAQMLLDCNNKGGTWQARGSGKLGLGTKYCYPYPDAKGDVTAWRITE